MTREEALDIEEKETINPRIPPELDSFLDDIQISKDEFESSASDWKRVEKFRSKSTINNLVESAYRKLARTR